MYPRYGQERTVDQGFVTSREEPSISNVFRKDTVCRRVDIRAEEQTESDIRHYVTVKSTALKIPLSAAQVDLLAKQAGGLFIWCSTLLKYLEKSTNPIYDLNLFLSGANVRDPLKQLYLLYDSTIMTATHAGITEDITLRQAILGVILVSAANRPLSARAVSAFLTSHVAFKRGSEEAVRKVTQTLHAVLYEDVNMDNAIRAYHPSLYNYIQEKLVNASRKGVKEGAEGKLESME